MGLAVAQKYADPKGLEERLLAGAKADCTIVVRKRDHKTLKVLEALGAENVERWEPPQEWMKDTAGRNNSFLLDVDHMLVFHHPGSTTTDYFVRKATEYPYSLSFADKIEIVQAKIGKQRT